MTRLRPILGLTLFTVLFLAAFGSQAAMVKLTYDVQASAFEDSNSNPPSGSTSTSVNGRFSFTFDDTFPVPQTGLALDSVIDFDITRSDGLLIDFNTGNTLVRIAQLGGPGDPRRITFGGAVNGEHQMVGLTEPGDFRAVFDVSANLGYAVTNAIQPFGFVFLTRFDPFYDAHNYSVQLVSAQVIPLPGAVWLFGAGVMGLVGVAGRRRSGARA